MADLALRFRRAVKSDAVVLAEFGARTFQEAFGRKNSPQDMEAYLALNYGVSQQTNELQDPDIITVLAEVEGQLVAYTQVRRHLPPGSLTVENPVELWRFYVDSPWHGRGVAQRLMEHVHAAADELGGQFIWLSVWERNERAVAFYKKRGFRIAGTKEFRLGSDVQTDYVMTAEIIKPPPSDLP